jgi:GNAT superfamily N-acetyltransferase
MQIRNATLADLEIISELMREMYDTPGVVMPLPPEAPARALHKSLEADSAMRFWLFEEEGQVIGYSTVVHYWLNEYGPVLYLDEFFIRAQARGKGYGQEYIHYMEQYARTQGIKVLHLFVAPKNQYAIRLYERKGYKPMSYNGMVKHLQE